MRKSLTLVIIAVFAVILSACDPDQGAPIKSVTYDVPPPTVGDVDGPTVDREDTGRTLPQFPCDGCPREREDDSRPLNDSEQARLDSWSGTGDQPFGDGANDGRFRDVTCDIPTGQPLNGYAGGTGCAYRDGTFAAQGIAYRDGVWYWGPMPITSSGECPHEESCVISWDHATTSPH